VRKSDYVYCDESIKCRDPLINIYDLFRKIRGFKGELSPEAGNRSMIDMEGQLGVTIVEYEVYVIPNFGLNLFRYASSKLEGEA